MSDQFMDTFTNPPAVFRAKRKPRSLASPPCPNGCGCVTAEDPDRNDCACDGPCCMDPDWPEMREIP